MPILLRLVLLGREGLSDHLDPLALLVLLDHLDQEVRQRREDQEGLEDHLDRVDRDRLVALEDRQMDRAVRLGREGQLPLEDL